MISTLSATKVKIQFFWTSNDVFPLPVIPDIIQVEGDSNLPKAMSGENEISYQNKDNEYHHLHFIELHITRLDNSCIYNQFVVAV